MTLFLSLIANKPPVISPFEFINRAAEKYDPEHLGPKMIKDDIENDRYIEIWNIVFSQFNSKEGLKRKIEQDNYEKSIEEMKLKGLYK